MTTPAAPERADCPDCHAEQRVNQDGTIRKHKSGPVPCAGSGRPIGPARIPRPSSAGYYRDPETGEYLRRVTTILNQGSPKGGLTQWAANITAETAMEHLPYLIRASMHPDQATEAQDWLRMAHDRAKEERGGIGTAAHRLIEAHILGTPLPTELTEDPEMAPYVDHFKHFVDDWQIEFTASEMVVAHYEEGYAGTLDYHVRSPLLADALDCDPDTDIAGDTKTGGEIDQQSYEGYPKGVYPAAGIQMAAYRHATHGWTRDGTKFELPRVHGVGIVLHLRPEGYRLYPLRCGDEEFRVFRHMRQVAEWNSRGAKAVIGAALTPHKTRKEAA